MKLARLSVLGVITSLSVLVGGCAGSPAGDEGTSAAEEGITIGAIPDQDPEQLQRLYGTLAGYLSDELGVPVDYEPVTDYNAAVNLFRSGDLNMVWFGGLTGVQARLQVDGAEAVLQRGIDEEFRSVFIAHRDSGIEPFEAIEGLSAMAGKRFTFGSESSTSGRLMPQYFLGDAGVTPDDFQGQPGFSGSHHATIELVEAGTFEAGVLNEQVWEARAQAGEVDTDAVEVVFRTPTYHDYHWVVRPELRGREGGDFLKQIVRAFTGLDASNQTEAQILELFGAEEFIVTSNHNYAEIERIGRETGLIN
ncbi:MAG: putative selenate ABC transporter substrate-binding protein [Actinobacteria bacterium]|nr:putative selenate ABC transporter substrate-binding protein [Actinomycetota bacterium]